MAAQPTKDRGPFTTSALAALSVFLLLCSGCDTAENRQAFRSLPERTNASTPVNGTQFESCSIQVGPELNYLVLIQADRENGIVMQKSPALVYRGDIGKLPAMHRNAEKIWGIGRDENSPVEYFDSSPVILYSGADQPLKELAPDWDPRYLNEVDDLKKYVEELLRRAGELQ